MDVDGTLTDGKIYIAEHGELFKAFDVKDGYAIHDVLPRHGIRPVIITGRSSEIVSRRCEELGINEVHQGIKDKLACLNTLLERFSKEDGAAWSLANVAYIGDDLPDLPCMLAVKNSGGMVGCPADAHAQIREISNYVCKKNAGNGAVREFIERLSGQALF